MSYGVLPHDEAEKLYKKVLKRKKGGGAVASTSSAPAPVKKKKKAKVIKEEGYDPDMQSSGAEAVGSAVI